MEDFLKRYEDAQKIYSELDAKTLVEEGKEIEKKQKAEKLGNTSPLGPAAGNLFDITTVLLMGTFKAVSLVGKLIARGDMATEQLGKFSLDLSKESPLEREYAEGKKFYKKHLGSPKDREKK